MSERRKLMTGADADDPDGIDEVLSALLNVEVGDIPFAPHIVKSVMLDAATIILELQDAVKAWQETH